MSQSVNEQTFSVKDIDVSKLRDIQIIDVSEDLYCGRRFQVLYTDRSSGNVSISDPTKLSKIINKVKRISKCENSLDDLKEIKSFLVTLEGVERDAKAAYSNRGCLYKFFTRIQRLFHSGAHLERIKKIKADTQGRINKEAPDTIDFDARIDPIKRIESFSEQQGAILLLIEECLAANQPEAAFSASVYLADQRKENEMLIKIARAFIENGDLSKAYPIVRKINPLFAEKIEFVEEIVTACLTCEQPDLDTALQAIALISPNKANQDTIERLTAMVNIHLT